MLIGLSGDHARQPSAASRFPYSALSQAVLLAGLSLAPALVVRPALAAPAVQEQRAASYSIPAGTLDQVLNQFAAAAGVALTIDGALTEGRRSAGLAGRYSVHDGFAELLRGHGLQALRETGDRYLLSRIRPGQADAAGDTVLPMVMVRGRADAVTEGTGAYTATGPDTSATGLALGLRDTPQSVTVITRQRMDDENLGSMARVMDVTPGISLVRAGATGSPAVGEIFYARGFEISNYQLDGVPTSQLGLQAMAGTRSGIGGTSTSIYDRITVVRGAAGLLNGAGNPAAAINFVRKRPTSEFQGAAEVSVGRWSRTETEVDVSGPLNAGKTLRGRLVAGTGAGGEWMDRHDGALNSVLYGVLEADLSPATLLTLGLEHTRSKDRGISFNNFVRVDTAGDPTRFWRTANASAAWAYADVSRSNAFATLDHRFDNGWTARVSVNHTRLDHDQFFGFARGDIDATTNASSLEYGRNRFTPGTTGVETHVTGKYPLFGRQHELMAGVSHERLDATDPGYDYMGPWNSPDVFIPDIYDFARTGAISVPAPARNGTERTRIRQDGGYVATRLNPVDGLAVIAGARVSDYRERTNYSDLDESGVVTPYLGVVVDLSRQLSAYGSYTTIFNPQSYQDSTGRTLDPEEGTNYEAGLKGEFLDGRVNASAAVFRTRKDNLALLDPSGALTPSGDDAYVAADNTQADGYELELSGEVAQSWRLMGGYSQVIVRAKDGRRLMQDTPMRQMKLFTSYDLGGRLDGLTLGGGVTWQGRTSHPYDSNPVLAQDSFAVFSLMARYRLSRQLSATLNVANLTDETYLSTVWYHNYGTPRNVTATLRYQF